jgi:hypothetical protein
MASHWGALGTREVAGGRALLHAFKNHTTQLHMRKGYVLVAKVLLAVSLVCIFAQNSRRCCSAV